MLTCVWCPIHCIFICRNPRGLGQECVAAYAQLNGKHSADPVPPHSVS